jgi:flagellar hook-basal body complex protein FliE
MVDPLGLMRTTPTTGPMGPGGGSSPASRTPGVDGPTFKDVLLENLNKVNQLQADATTAIEDLQTGRRTDLETVLGATAKADTAFRMLLAVRNKMMDAYEEIKAIRV